MTRLTLPSVVAFFFASPALAQDATQNKLETLETRIQLLERQLLDMAKRLERMEELLKKPAKAKAEKVPEGIAPPVMVWRTLKKGMTEEQVKKILGEPKRIDMRGGGAHWLYEVKSQSTAASNPGVPGISRPTVAIAYFDELGRLFSWDEP